MRFQLHHSMFVLFVTFADAKRNFGNGRLVRRSARLLQVVLTDIDEMK